MFKVGDKVGVRHNCSGCVPGKIYKIGLIGRELYAISEKGSGCNCESNLFLIKSNKNMKLKKVNFILKYELDEDPIEEFETMVQVEKRIKELLENESLQKESMVVYEVKSVKQVKIETKITIS